MNRNDQQGELVMGKVLTVVDAIDQWVERAPDKIAFRFLKEDGLYDVVSYAELHRWARVIGSALRREYAAGSRAILLFPPGLDFVAAFLGCLYAGIVAVPVCSPRLNRPSTPLTAIIRNCRPQLSLTTADYAKRRSKIFSQIPELLSLSWMSTEVHRGAPITGGAVTSAESALALLQYTSGSTGVAKGVMVTRANLAHNSWLIQTAFGTSPETRGVFWLPHYHDMGLIGGILGTLYSGGSSVLMSPLALIRRPLSWLEMISKTQATITGGPDFSYALCTEKVSPAQREHLDLSSLEVAFSGAEPVRLETIDRFSKTFGACGFQREAFVPCYGLAEATLMVSSRLRSTAIDWLELDAVALERDLALESNDSQNRRRVVSCGTLLPQQQVKIVDPSSGRQCADDQIGEIWVCGPSVARGYWDNVDATRATFHEQRDNTGAMPRTYLRTGDLGFVHNGELYVTGRIKDLIIVRGRNLYPQDIEWTAQCSSASLKGAIAAAFSLEVDGREELAIVLELERRMRGEEYEPLIQAVRQAVGAEHEVSVHAVVLVRAGIIPRTSSGKLRRGACREAYLAGALDVLHAWVGNTSDGWSDEPRATNDATSANAPDAVAIRCWLVTKISGLTSLPEDRVNVAAPFASFGLSSLQGVMLVEQLQTFVGREIPATWFYNYPSIAELTHRLTGDDDTAVVKTTARDDTRLWNEVSELSAAELETLVAEQMTNESYIVTERR
ncbi:MAG: AMP-binding protein [Gammaproteobacteria bacterium]|nr:AMP-binding protein [Gammaproteobacteria bacterium]